MKLQESRVKSPNTEVFLKKCMDPSPSCTSNPLTLLHMTPHLPHLPLAH